MPYGRFWNSQPRGYSLLGAGLLAWHAWLLQKSVLEFNQPSSESCRGNTYLRAERYFQGSDIGALQCL